MKIKFSLRPVLGLILLPALLTCHRFVVRPIPNQEQHNNWPQYRANPARTGNNDASISTPLELAWIFKPNSALENSLILTDSVLYFGTKDGYIYSLDIRNGKKIGRKKFHFASTCAYHNHHLLIARRYGRETLFNYDLSRGKYKWKIDAGDIQTEPLIHDDGVYIAALYKHIDRYELATGNKSWTFKTESQLHSTPALSRGILVAGSDAGIIYAIDSKTGNLKWTFQTEAAIYATPVIANGTVYLGSFDRHLYAIDLQEGTLQWKFATEAKIHHAAAIAGNRVLVSSNDYGLYCLNASNGTLFWKFSAKSVVSTAPTIARNMVFIGSIDKHYYAVALDSGNLLWKYETKGRIRTTPIVYNNHLFGASENHHLYAFRPEVKGDN